MTNESSTPQASNPVNRQTVFAKLRDVLAGLYSDLENTQITAKDAGLDTNQIKFGGSSQTIWDNILTEAVKQNLLDALLDVVDRGPYSKNPGYVAARNQYREFKERGGQIHSLIDYHTAPTSSLPNPCPYWEFIERPEAYVEVVDALRTKYSVTLLTGLSGMGKTSLIRYIAERCVNHESDIPTFDAVVWQDTNITLDSIFYAIAQTYHYSVPIQLKDLAGLISTLVSTQSILFVIDNAETITDNALLTWLLGLPNRSKAIIIGRDLPIFKECPHIKLDAMAENEALNFVRQRLKIKDETVDLSGYKPLVAATGGNPHAIALALAQLEVRELNDIVNEIVSANGEIFKELLYPRIWQLLKPKAKQILMAVTLFPISASRQALIETTKLEGNGLNAALQQLVDMSLLNSDLTNPNHRRFSMHPLTYSFARRQLSGYKIWTSATHIRWLEWAARFAEKVNWCWDDLSKLDILEPEKENIYAAIEWAAKQHDDILLDVNSDPNQAKYLSIARENSTTIDNLIIRIAMGVDHYYYVRGPWDKKIAIDQMRIAATRRLNILINGQVRNELAKALAQHIQLLCTKGDIEELEEKKYFQLLETVEEQGISDVDIRIQVEHAYAFYDMACNKFDNAYQKLEKCMQAKPQPSPNLAVATLHWLATCAYRKGLRATEPHKNALLVEAEGYFSKALEQADKINYQRSVTYCRLNLGRIFLEQGKPKKDNESGDESLLDRATTFLEKSLDEARLLKEPRYIVQIQIALRQLYMLRKNDSAADTAFAEAKELCDWLGLKRKEEILKADGSGTEI